MPMYLALFSGESQKGLVRLGEGMITVGNVVSVELSTLIKAKYLWMRAVGWYNHIAFLS